MEIKKYYFKNVYCTIIQCVCEKYCAFVCTYMYLYIEFAYLCVYISPLSIHLSGCLYIDACFYSILLSMCLSPQILICLCACLFTINFPSMIYSTHFFEICTFLYQFSLVHSPSCHFFIHGSMNLFMAEILGRPPPQRGSLACHP